MPKEQINFPLVCKAHHSCSLPTDTGDDGPCACIPTADVMPSVAVRWGAGGHDKLDISNVQITLVEYEEPTWDEWLASDPWGTGSTSSFPTPPVKREVHSAVLTRSEINKLIQTLRRARDAAYGKDE